MPGARSGAIDMASESRGSVDLATCLTAMAGRWPCSPRRWNYLLSARHDPNDLRRDSNCSQDLMFSCVFPLAGRAMHLQSFATELMELTKDLLKIQSFPEAIVYPI